MFARGCDDQLVFARVMTARLFDVDVLPRIERENRGGRVPVIRGRDRDRVDVLVLKHPAKVGHGFGWRRLEGRRGRERFR
ncbi:MAG: hypothetical protein PVSMB1_15140 [Gemmatimonadaceae bacterium]